MAGDRDIDLTISATDKASKVIEGVSDEVAKLDDVTLEVDADVGEAKSRIQTLAEQVEGLTDTAREVRIEFAEKQLERQLQGILKQLDQVDDPVAIAITQTDLENTLTDMEELRELAGRDIEFKVNVDDQVGTSLDKVESSARAAGASVGTIGGAIGELPGIEGLGPVAEGLGQLSEAALEGEASIKDIGKALAIMGGTAVVLQGVQKVMQSIAESKAFDEEKAKEFKEAIDDVGDSTRAVLDVIKQTQSVTGRAGGLLGTRVLDDTKDITKQLDAAGVSVEQFALAVQRGGEPLDEAVGKLEAMKTAAEEAFKQDPTDEAKRKKILEYNDAIEILKETHKTYSDQVSNDESWAHWIAGGDTAKATTDAWNRTLEEGIGWLDGTADSMHGTSDKTKDLTDAYADAKQKANDLTYANQLLRGDLDQHGAYLRLQAQFDETKRKGQEAMDAVKTGASDADEKMRDYELSVIDSKTAVMDFNDEWGTVDTDQTLQMNTQIDRGEFDQVLVDVGKATSTTHWIDVRVRTTVDRAWNEVIDSIRFGGSRT